MFTHAHQRPTSSPRTLGAAGPRRSVDVRHDLAQPEPGARRSTDAGHIPGARVRASRPRPVRRRRPAPTAAIRCPTPEACGGDVRPRSASTRRKQVVAYDQGSGMFAARLWWMLRWLGTKRSRCSTAASPNGCAKAARSRPTSPTPRRATFAVAARRADASNVDAASMASTRAAALLAGRCARAGALPRRSRAARSGRRPHPGRASTGPAQHNLDADGTFKSAGALRAEFGALLGGAPHRQSCTTAARASRPATTSSRWRSPGCPERGSTPGSWSEWCADPATAADRARRRASAAKFVSSERSHRVKSAARDSVVSARRSAAGTDRISDRPVTFHSSRIGADGRAMRSHAAARQRDVRSKRPRFDREAGGVERVTQRACKRRERRRDRRRRDPRDAARAATRRARRARASNADCGIAIADLPQALDRARIGRRR